MIESCVTFLPVKDLEETTRFYSEVVGLKLWKKMDGCVIFDCHRGYWGFCQYDDGRPLATGVCMSLNCANRDEVDEQYRRLQNLGIALTEKPMQNSTFPVYSFFFHDPNGYLLEFQKITDEE